MAETKVKFPTKKVLLAAATVLMIAFFFVTPFAGLSDVGMKFLGIFIWWIVLMATAVIPNHMACIAALLVAVVTGVSNFAGAFTAYSSSTCMLLIGAFGMATALANSGILNRIALLVMKLFPGTYTGQLWAVSVASLILAPTIPSASAKCSILMPIVGTISDEMGYEPHSRGATGLLSCCNTITNFIGLMFMTGGVGCMLMLSLSAVSITWMGWLKFALVWGVVMFVLTVLFHQFYYNPAKDGGEAKTLDKKVIQERINALGAMSGKETAALIVLIAAIVLWVTESYHGIPTAAVALGAWVVLSCFGLFSFADFSTKIAWSVWAMVGGILGITGLLSASGVAPWLGTLVAPIVAALSSSPLLLVLVITLLHVVLVFGLVTYAVTGSIFISMLSAAPISPLCIIFTACQGSSTFVLPFQQIGVVASIGMAGGRIEHKDIVPAAWAFVVSNIIAIMLSVPWWRFLGFI